MSHDLPRTRHEAVRVPSKHWLRRAPAALFGLGATATFIALALRGDETTQFGFSFLTAFVFFVSISVGALFFLCVHHVSRAGWSTAIRRLAEHLVAILPLFAVLFVVIASSIDDIYQWSRPELIDPASEHYDSTLAGKRAYLNEAFFVGRSMLMFTIWSVLAIVLYRGSTRQDRTGDLAMTLRLRWVAAVGLVVFTLTVTVAALDWIMSLDPHWHSSIFGVYFFAGSAAAAIAALIIVSFGLQRAGLLTTIITTEHYHDLGKLLFGFVAFWAYIAFCQYFLIWFADKPEEARWFVYRWEGSWQTVSVVLAVGHFALPFLFLLARRTKRRPGLLVVAALWMMAMHLVDVYWLIQPTYDHLFLHPDGAPGAGATFHVLDVLCLLGVGGLVTGAATWLAVRQSLAPIQDPRLEESLALPAPPADPGGDDRRG